MMARIGCGQVPPRIFLHEFLKPREDIKKSLQAKRIFEYKCNTTIYAPRPFVPITVTHPSFTPWWQELHDHIFNVPVHPLCLELMPDFHPTSEVIYLFPSFFNHVPFYGPGFCLFPAGYSTCPSCQDNLLQYQRPNLCLGISISHSGPTDV
jgi:hypothetical protein